jgi:hypothetical protein
MKTIRRFWRRARGLWTVARLVSGFDVLQKRSNREVILFTTPNPDVSQIKSLREALDEFGMQDIPMIVLREGYTLRNIPETEMRRFGWHRR